MELDSSIDTAAADSSFQSGALKQRALDIDSSVVLSSDDSADSEQILAMSSKAKKVLPSPRTMRSEATDKAGEEAVPLGPVRSSGLSCYCSCGLSCKQDPLSDCTGMLAQNAMKALERAKERELAEAKQPSPQGAVATVKEGDALVQQGSLDEGLELYRDALRQFGGKRPKLEEKIKGVEAKLAAARRGGGKKKKKDVLAGLDSSDEDSDASFNVPDVL